MEDRKENLVTVGY